MLRNRLIELRYLIPLRRVRIKVVLARKDACLANLAVDRLGGKHRKLHRFAIQYRQRSGQPKAGRTGVRVRLPTILVDAPAEGLRLGQKLNMDLQPNDRLVLGKNLRRKWGGRHIQP